MNYSKILLTVFITGLSINSVCAQSENLPLYSGEEAFCYDSSEVAKIAEVILENEMFQQNHEFYTKKDSLYRVNRIILEGKISSLK